MPEPEQFTCPHCGDTICSYDADRVTEWIQFHIIRILCKK